MRKASVEGSEQGGNVILWERSRVCFWMCLFKMPIKYPGGDVRQGVG